MPLVEGFKKLCEGDKLDIFNDLTVPTLISLKDDLKASSLPVLRHHVVRERFCRLREQSRKHKTSPAPDLHYRNLVKEATDILAGQVPDHLPDVPIFKHFLQEMHRAAGRGMVLLCSIVLTSYAMSWLRRCEILHLQQQILRNGSMLNLDFFEALAEKHHFLSGEQPQRRQAKRAVDSLELGKPSETALGKRRAVSTPEGDNVLRTAPGSHSNLVGCAAQREIAATSFPSAIPSSADAGLPSFPSAPGFATQSVPPIPHSLTSEEPIVTFFPNASQDCRVALTPTAFTYGIVYPCGPDFSVTYLTLKDFYSFLGMQLMEGIPDIDLQLWCPWDEEELATMHVVALPSLGWTAAFEIIKPRAYQLIALVCLRHMEML